MDASRFDNLIDADSAVAPLIEKLDGRGDQAFAPGLGRIRQAEEFGDRLSSQSWHAVRNGVYPWNIWGVPRVHCSVPEILNMFRMNGLARRESRLIEAVLSKEFFGV